MNNTKKTFPVGAAIGRPHLLTQKRHVILSAAEGGVEGSFVRKLRLSGRSFDSLTLAQDDISYIFRQQKRAAIGRPQQTYILTLLRIRLLMLSARAIFTASGTRYGTTQVITAAPNPAPPVQKSNHRHPHR